MRYRVARNRAGITEHLTVETFGDLDWSRIDGGGTEFDFQIAVLFKAVLELKEIDREIYLVVS